MDYAKVQKNLEDAQRAKDAYFAKCRTCEHYRTIMCVGVEKVGDSPEETCIDQEHRFYQVAHTVPEQFGTRLAEHDRRNFCDDAQVFAQAEIDIGF